LRTPLVSSLGKTFLTEVERECRLESDQRFADPHLHAAEFMDKFLKRKLVSDQSESLENKQLSSSESTSAGKKARFRRLYCDDYLKFGFHWTGDEQMPSPLCVVGGQKLSNEAMVPSKLKRHFITNHSNLQTKTIVYCQRLLQANSRQSKLFQKAMTVSEKAHLASYEVAEIIAPKSKSYVLAESVILPPCEKMVKVMFGDKVEQEISKIPLSNHNIQRRIIDLSDNIEQNVMTELNNCQFAIQTDESTDISNHAQLIAFVRFIDEGVIINQFLCCKNLPSTTKGQDVFDILTTYLKKHGLSWDSCAGICTDGAPSMVGSVKGFISCAKTQSYYCANSLFFTQGSVSCKDSSK